MNRLLTVKEFEAECAEADRMLYRRVEALRAVRGLEDAGNTTDALLFIDAHCTEFPDDAGIFVE